MLLWMPKAAVYILVHVMIVLDKGLQSVIGIVGVVIVPIGWRGIDIGVIISH